MTSVFTCLLLQILSTKIKYDKALRLASLTLVDVSDIFYFSCSGGKGESEAPGKGGVRFLLKIPGGGGFPGGRGVEGPGGCLRRIGEFLGRGGGNIFFQGRNVHQVTCFT